MNYTKNYYKTGDDGFLYHVVGGKERRVTSQAEVDAWAVRHNPNGRFKMPLLRKLRKDERQCEVCGRIYRYKSNSQKFCPECREEGYRITRRAYNARRKAAQKLRQEELILKAHEELGSNNYQTAGFNNELGTVTDFELDRKYDPSQWDE